MSSKPPGIGHWLQGKFVTFGDGKAYEKVVLVLGQQPHAQMMEKLMSTPREECVMCGRVMHAGWVSPACPDCIDYALESTGCKKQSGKCGCGVTLLKNRSKCVWCEREARGGACGCLNPRPMYSVFKARYVCSWCGRGCDPSAPTGSTTIHSVRIEAVPPHQAQATCDSQPLGSKGLTGPPAPGKPNHDTPSRAGAPSVSPPAHTTLSAIKRDLSEAWDLIDKVYATLIKWSIAGDRLETAKERISSVQAMINSIDMDVSALQSILDDWRGKP